MYNLPNCCINSEDDMQFNVVIRRWILERPDEMRKLLQSMVDDYFYKGVVFGQLYRGK